MKIRKIAAALLSAIILGTAASTAVFARDFIPDDELTDYLTSGNHTIGITGDFTNWNSMNDIIMTDADGDGVYIGVIRDLDEGVHELKVRTDCSWEDNWGAYEAEKDSSFNSLQNFSVTVEKPTDVFVTFDTRGENYLNWSIAAYSTEEMTPGKYGITGTITQWESADKDYPMYEITPGKYVGIIKDAPFGQQQFVIRNAENTDEIYAVYEAEYDRTRNSQINCKTIISGSGDIIVEFDTTGEDEALWPVSFAVIDGEGNISDIQYTGKGNNLESSVDESSVVLSSENEESESMPQLTESSQENSEKEIILENSTELKDPSGNESKNTSVEQSGKSGNKSSGVSVNSVAGTTNSAVTVSASANAPSTGSSVLLTAICVTAAAAALGVIVLLGKGKKER